MESMRRMVFLTGVVSFAMAFLGTVMASTLAVPAVVGAQEARIRAEAVTVVGGNGADRVSLRTAPSGRAFVEVLGADGSQRLSAGTGGGPGPDEAGFVVRASDGTTSAARLGTGRGPVGDGPLRNSLTLFDGQEQARVALAVGEDGTPSIRMLDASGNVTWEAK
jgi:hypothetical protein